MDFTFTPSRSPETCQLSPTHLRNVSSYLDLRNIDRNIRRSMSRSPSRFTTTARPTAHSPLHSPGPSTPRSPLRHHASTSTIVSTPTYGDENAPASARKTRSSRPALTRSAPIRGLFKTAQMQAQATPQPLGESSDFGNSSSQSSSETELVYNAQSFTLPGAPLDTFEHALAQSKARNMPIRTPSTRARTVAEKELSQSRDWAPAKSSPLKRSDGSITSRDSGNTSPSAKRRSLNGTSSDGLVDSRQTDEPDFQTMDEDISPEEAKFRASLPPSAFRKSMYQSRGSSKSTTARNRRSLESGTPSSTPKRASIRPRPRTSVDSLIRKDSHEALFLDAHPDDIPRPLHITRSTRQHPHPLSQALSPNSPRPERESVSFDSPLPQRQRDFDSQAPSDRPSLFSKSLPIGALRPRESKFVQGNDNGSFATPRAFDNIRPDPAVFMSTGLISKRHRNPDELPPPPNGRGMPDTPCKRTFNANPLPSSPGSIASIAKPRFGQPAFGTPSRPSGLHSSRPGPSAFSKSFGQFEKGQAKPTFDRRSSFTSNDGEEFLQSPTRGRESAPDSQSSADELPPTPTKQHPQISASKSSSLRSSIFGRRPAVSLNTDTFVTPDLPRQSSFSKSLTGERAPQTPIVDNGIPDPSLLSISPSNKAPLSRTSIIRTPATPSHRDSHGPGMPGLVATPSHHVATQDVDASMLSRFKRIEWHAKGEFSDVYKVFQSPAGRSYFSPSNSSKAQWTPVSDCVYMVKKSRSPYVSAKAREKQLREPQIMQALGKSDHIVHLMDFWEAQNFLYMQMEFCEEGTLSTFLAKQGNLGRLDDFRIWKILIELTQGVKHIHDNNFMHLDLKPENVFIDFEGTLKIGDFGLASPWPAPRNLEGEGDRRYMGPDLLIGAFDKPADVFALGMIMYETAANCILPDNGGYWQKLRSGDFSGLPSLTSAESLTGDAPEYLKTASSNLDTEQSRSTESLFSPTSSTFDTHASIDTRMTSWDGWAPPEKSATSDTELASPPAFMLDPNDAESLDKVVQWMMLPDPSERPDVSQILGLAGCLWVSSRRRSGAVIFEGRWGPADHMLPPPSFDEEDSVMTDV